MNKLKFIALTACLALACDATIVSAQSDTNGSIAGMLEGFEAESERRRSEEGENFDEAAYDFERSMMERRSALDERRIALDEEFNNKRDELSNSPSGQDQNAWEELDQETQRAFGVLEAEYHALDKEGQEYWEGRQREEERSGGDEPPPPPPGDEPPPPGDEPPPPPPEGDGE